MKQTLVYILCAMTLTASNCKEENEECHYNIRIENNSSSKIIAATSLQNVEHECILDGKIINKGDFYLYKPFNYCIENSMDNSTTIDVYLVDPTLFNTTNLYYNCDSIEIKNKILKHHILTLDDLKQINFTISYP